ncbi:hypothetical protein BH20ACT19_BH20ACT19_12560 [soil metagenome]
MRRLDRAPHAPEHEIENVARRAAVGVLGATAPAQTQAQAIEVRSAGVSVSPDADLGSLSRLLAANVPRRNLKPLTELNAAQGGRADRPSSWCCTIRRLRRSGR